MAENNQLNKLLFILNDSQLMNPDNLGNILNATVHHLVANTAQNCSGHLEDPHSLIYMTKGWRGPLKIIKTIFGKKNQPSLKGTPFAPPAKAETEGPGFGVTLEFGVGLVEELSHNQCINNVNIRRWLMGRIRYPRDKIACPDRRGVSLHLLSSLVWLMVVSGALGGASRGASRGARGAEIGSLARKRSMRGGQSSGFYERKHYLDVVHSLDGVIRLAASWADDNWLFTQDGWRLNKWKVLRSPDVTRRL